MGLAMKDMKLLHSNSPSNLPVEKIEFDKPFLKKKKIVRAEVTGSGLLETPLGKCSYMQGKCTLPGDG